MRKAVALIGVAALGLTGCAPVIVYDQPGVTVAQLASDLERCALRARSIAPRDVQRERRTVEVIEYRYGVPRIAYDRQWVDVDINAGLREESRLNCLEAAGYSLAQIPSCSAGRAGEITPATRQVAASETSCAAKISGVGPVILPGS
ncbi:hypothetical protein [Dinoroseobacter sp. S375]|uniref:hypothetical protein n=1 Tax=Dinoroseobacter sp. S375 TaxID=3415136 RepID=UPI003C7C86B3